MGNRAGAAKRDVEWEAAIAASTWPYTPLVRELKDTTDILFKRGYVIRGEVKLLGMCRRRALDLAGKMVLDLSRSDVPPPLLREAVLSATELQRLVHKMRFTKTFSDEESYSRVRRLFDNLVLALTAFSGAKTGDASACASANEDDAPGPE